MGRSIVYAQPESTSSSRSGPTSASRSVPAGGVVSGPEEDKYGDVLLKMIPAEVITLYVAMDGVISSNGDNSSPAVVGGVFVFCLVATWFYLQVFQKVEDKLQIAVSVIAFAIWAVNIGEGIKGLSLINQSYSALALLAFTFIAPKIPLQKKVVPLPPL
jgi:hypothetical protein